MVSRNIRLHVEVLFLLWNLRFTEDEELCRILLLSIVSTEVGERVEPSRKTRRFYACYV